MIGSKIVKIRKNHYCYTCGTLLHKGAKMWCHCNPDGGYICTWYQCDTCRELYDKYNQGYDENIEEVFSLEVLDACYGYGVDTPRQLLKILRKTEEKKNDN